MYHFDETVRFASSKSHKKAKSYIKTNRPSPPPATRRTVAIYTNTDSTTFVLICPLACVCVGGTHATRTADGGDGDTVPQRRGAAFAWPELRRWVRQVGMQAFLEYSKCSNLHESAQIWIDCGCMYTHNFIYILIKIHMHTRLQVQCRRRL